MNKFIVLALLTCAICSCRENNQFVQTADYLPFLQSKLSERKEHHNAAEISFWQNKLNTDTGNFIYKQELGFHVLSRFQLYGRAEDLLTADSLFISSSAKLNNSNPELFYTRSQNAITLHRFADALTYTKLAEEKGGAAYTNRLLFFDAAMETGMYQSAEIKLNQLSDKQGFDYLIRKAKLEDHYGRLDEAILLMEKALDKASTQPGGPAYNWVLSNLGDMYGHAGHIEEAYQSYLSVLKQDSTNLHCLKGIAWIAYSHDKNTTAAKQILHFIQSKTALPDVHLLLAEIAAFENNHAEKEKQLTLFIKEAERPVYGAMYNKYLLDIYTTGRKDTAKVLAIAVKENKSRPTPETFTWLAAALHSNGQTAEATAIIRKYILQQTAEPDLLAICAEVLAANGNKPEAKSLYKACLESSFEMGPVKTAAINRQLALL